MENHCSKMVILFAVLCCFNTAMAIDKEPAEQFFQRSETVSTVDLFKHRSDQDVRNDALQKLYFFDQVADVLRFAEVELHGDIVTEDALRTGSTVHLNLFYDTQYQAEISSVKRNINGTITVMARVADKKGYVIIATTGQRTLGSIYLPSSNRYYKIISDPNTLVHYLIEMDASDRDIIETSPPLIPEETQRDLEEQKRIRKQLERDGLGPDDPANIDVMIVYTNAAQNWANSNGGGINNVIALSMANAQLVLDNSQTLMTVTLVHSSLVAYTESGNSSTDLVRLTEENNGYMDEVHTWRDQYGADLVALFPFVQDTGGLAWLLINKFGTPTHGFSLTRVQQAGWTYTHIHEMGHNMGCHHHKNQNVQPGPTDWWNWPENIWSAGWRWTGNDGGHYCTVMTYASGQYYDDGIDHTEVPYFSNPLITYQGVATGHPVDGDNTRTLREIKHIIAAYRESQDDDDDDDDEEIEIPWTETFSGVPVGQIPANWSRTHTNWSVQNTANAGGAAPEMRFNWSPPSADQFRVTSAKINTSGHDALVLGFDHYIDNFSTPGVYTLRVIAIADDVEYVVQEWVDPDNIGPNHVEFILTAGQHGVGSEDFYIAWELDGDSYDINYWYFDNVSLGEASNMFEVIFFVGEDNIDETPIEGASINIGGDIYHTDENGLAAFMLADNQTYSANVTASGYVAQEITFTVDGADLSVDVLLVDDIEEPFNLSVITENMEPGEALFRWNDYSDDYEFRYDDGIVNGQLGFQGAWNSVMGAVHFNDAILNEMTWYLTSEGGPHNTVKLWVLGLTPEGLPDRNNIVYTAENVPNNDNQWNLYQFATPIEMPEGFFIGLSYDGFLGLAIDDGVGAPWDFIPGTQFGVFNITDPNSAFTDISVWGFEVNYLLRAFGSNLGDLSRSAYSGTVAVGPAPELIPLETRVYAGNPHFPQAGQRSFLGFNVYLNDALVAGEIEDTEYLFTGLPAGAHTAGVQSVYTTGSSEVVTIGFVIDEDTELYQVTFHVVDDTTEENPIEGALITIGDLNPIHTNEDGLATIELQDGSYTANVSKPGFTSELVDFTVDGEDKIVHVAMTGSDAPYSLPWSESFTGIPNGELPSNWTRDIDNWGVNNSSNAGGETPEMRFNWSPNVTGEFYLYSPKINTSGYDALLLSFKNFVNNFGGPGIYTLRVVTIADDVEHLVHEWVDPGDIPAHDFEAILTDSQHGVGTDDFHIAWVFDGVSNDINWWNFDDIFLGEAPDIYEVTFFVGEDNVNEIPIEGASININGDVYHTDENGLAVFMLHDNQTYTANVSAPGYVAGEVTFTVDGADVSVDVLLMDYILEPFNLNVITEDMDPGDALFTWNDSGDTYEFRYDDGVVVGQLGFQGTWNSVMGAVHFNDAILQEVTWYLTSEGGPHNTVKLWVFGLTPEGLPDRNNLVYTAENVANNDNEWNLYEFATPIEMPEGFFIGLSYNGFLGLATDDGVGAPWDFVPGTQFGVFNITDPTSAFTDISVWGFEVNFLLRAYGNNLGDLNRSAYSGTVAQGPAPELIPLETRVYAGDPHSPQPGQRGFLGFNVYLNDALVAGEIIETEYLFTNLPDGEHTAGVQSVYTTGSSDIVTIDFEMGECDPEPDTYPVTFNVSNQDGQPIPNAMITVTPDGDKSFDQPVKLTKSMHLTDSQLNTENHTLTASGNTKPGVVPSYDVVSKEGEWIEYWQGIGNVNESALGLGGDETAPLNTAIRWMPGDLTAYSGWEVSKIRIYINDEPEYGSVKIWQGAIDNPTEMVSQTMMVGEETWVEVDLLDPYLIDITQELWIGWEIGDPGDGVFPAAHTNGDEFSPLSDLLQFGDNPWQPASDYGFDVVWNIEAYIEPMNDTPDQIIIYTDASGQASFDALPGGYSYTVEKSGYFDASGSFSVSNAPVTLNVTMQSDDDDPLVTFNLDMTDVEGFDPSSHNVYLTGGFTGWAEPGQPGSLQMSLVRDYKSPPYNLYENFEGYDDFTTDLSPWITIQLTEGDTWGAGNFSFPGEGTEFAWMAFNPSETDPPVDDEHPAVDGSKYAVAVQYTDLDDDKWLISPEVSINQSSELSFWARSMTAVYGLERIRVLVSTSGDDPGSFIPISTEPYIEVPTDWTEYTFDLHDYAGEVIRFAINYVSHDAFFFMLDAISLWGYVPPDLDDLIYTVTVPVSIGAHQYKYFSNAFGDGWAGGEWDGDPNREIEVTGSMTVYDVWGNGTPPDPDMFTLTFEVEDAVTGDSITNAQITLNGDVHESGFYVFEDLLPGIYEYIVSHDDYFDQEGNVEIIDDHITMMISLTPDDTSIPDPDLVELHVFPNPAKSKLFIEGNRQIEEIRLLDMVGQLVYQSHYRGEVYEIDVTPYQNGIYLLQVMISGKVITQMVQVAR